MKATLIIIGSFICSQMSYGQNFSADMARVNNNYLHLNKNMQVTTQTTLEDGKQIRQQISMNILDVDHYFMKDEKTEVLVRDGIKVIASKDNKMIMLDSNYTEELTTLPISMFDTLQKGYSKIERKVLSDGNIQYELLPKWSTISNIHIILYSNSYLIKKLVLKSNVSSGKTQSIEFNYAYSPLQALPSVSNYVYLKSGAYVLSSQWTGYTLFNYLPKK